MSDLINYRLLLEYDGTDFFGWQVQVGQRTVQGELEKALEPLMGEVIRVNAAGRTDTGVHGLGQVANFHSSKNRPPDVVMKALNGTLPEDVRVLDASIAPAEFHSRFSAKWRHYRYRMPLPRPAKSFSPRYTRKGRTRLLGPWRSAWICTLPRSSIRTAGR